jgi:hypothetical protein
MAVAWVLALNVTERMGVRPEAVNKEIDRILDSNFYCMWESGARFVSRTFHNSFSGRVELELWMNLWMKKYDMYQMFSS